MSDESSDFVERFNREGGPVREALSTLSVNRPNHATKELRRNLLLSEMGRERVQWCSPERHRAQLLQAPRRNPLPQVVLLSYGALRILSQLAAAFRLQWEAVSTETISISA